MSPITSHVLNTATGLPASGMAASLDYHSANGWTPIARATTNADGRIADWLDDGCHLQPGVYRIEFATGDYFAANQIATFYPRVSVEFEIRDPSQHFHVPLLVSGFGYSTYRGS